MQKTAHASGSEVRGDNAGRGRQSLGILLAAVAASFTAPAALAQAPSDFVPVTDTMLQAPSPDDWLMWRRTLDGWGF